MQKNSENGGVLIKVSRLYLNFYSQVKLFYLMLTGRIEQGRPGLKQERGSVYPRPFGHYINFKNTYRPFLSIKIL
jgi:hypothetical protein